MPKEVTMKIAFPTQEPRGMDSPLYGHFGSAPSFIIVDDSSGSFEVVVNEDAHHQHGQCQPLNAIGGKPINAVVAAGIGAGALFKLNSAGIKVYRAIDGTVNDNLMLLKSGKLPEITMDMTCAGHGRQGGCVH